MTDGRTTDESRPTTGSGTSSVTGGTSSRDRLLAGAAAYISQHGFADVSLRELAGALGSSHRMLLYHFGSKQQLFVEIIRAFETEQRLMIEAFAADPNLSRAEVMRRVWRQVSAPEAADQVRLFFQVCGQALSGDAAASGLLEGIISDWLEPMVEVERERHARGRCPARGAHRRRPDAGTAARPPGQRRPHGGRRRLRAFPGDIGDMIPS